MGAVYAFVPVENASAGFVDRSRRSSTGRTLHLGLHGHGFAFTWLVKGQAAFFYALTPFVNTFTAS